MVRRGGQEALATLGPQRKAHLGFIIARFYAQPEQGRFKGGPAPDQAVNSSEEAQR